MMKSLKLFLYVMLISMGAGTIHAQSAEEQFALGNAAYQRQAYDTALIFYEAVAVDAVSPELYYNMGNAYFKQNDIVNAIVNYERALRLDPANLDIVHNLRLANSYTADKIEPLPQTQLAVWWNDLLRRTGADNWAVVALIASVMSAAGFALFMLSFSVPVRRSGFFGGLFFAAISLLCWWFSLSGRNYVLAGNEAIIQAERLEIRSEPRGSSPSVFILHEGAKVTVEQCQEEWCEISIANGNKGWVPADSFIRI